MVNTLNSANIDEMFLNLRMYILSDCNKLNRVRYFNTKSYSQKFNFKTPNFFCFSDKRVNGLSYRSNSFGDATGLAGVPRKTRFSVFGRLFKPWKWKRRKKSECFEHTSKSEFLSNKAVNSILSIT